MYGRMIESYTPHPGRYIGEESVAAGDKVELTDAPTWIIDPVDGTMNFVHSFPFICVSIGKVAIDCVPTPCDLSNSGCRVIDGL